MYDIVAQRLRLFLAKKDITCKIVGYDFYVRGDA